MWKGHLDGAVERNEADTGEVRHFWNAPHQRLLHDKLAPLKLGYV